MAVKRIYLGSSLQFATCFIDLDCRAGEVRRSECAFASPRTGNALRGIRGIEVHLCDRWWWFLKVYQMEDMMHLLHHAEMSGSKLIERDEQELGGPYRPYHVYPQRGGGRDLSNPVEANMSKNIAQHYFEGLAERMGYTGVRFW